MTNGAELESLIYNAHDKEEFLKQYENINTQKAFIRIFRNTLEFEEKHNKDVYLFNKAELEEIYEKMAPSTPISARNFGGMLNRYISWAVDEKKITEHPFPVQQHYFLKFVKDHNDPYLTLKELRYYTHTYFQNLQDGVILELLFFGIQGTEASEITNLTVDDIDLEKKSMRLFDGERKRIHHLEDESVLNYCLEANKDDRYFKRNGEMDYNPRIRPYSDLIMDTNYILKNSRTNTTHSEQATKYTVYNRLKGIQKFEEIEPIKHKITIKNIVKSGQIYMASKLFEKSEGQFSLSHIREICQYFGVNERWTMRDYLNEENILKYYPHLNGI